MNPRETDPATNGQTRVLHAEPAAPTYGINPPSRVPHEHPRKQRPWGRIFAAVIMLTLAAGLVLSQLQLHAMSATQSRTEAQVSDLSHAVGAVGQGTSANGGSVASLRSQLATVEQQIAALPPNLSKYGICLRVFTDNQGNVSQVTMATPIMNGGNATCPVGVLVSVMPVPGS